jgi:rubrerythrin
MESAVFTKEALTTKWHFRFNGISSVADDDSETGVYNAYLEFAFHRTMHDAEAYEDAARNSRSGEQKNLFVQLACRKQEVSDTLKMYRSDSSFTNDTGKKQSVFIPSKQPQQQTDKGMFATMNDAINFAFQRENRTLELYEKMAKTAHLFSIRALFDYLLESQRHQMLYLTTQCAAVGCLLL